jgi:hypothetical protein
VVINALTVLTFQNGKKEPLKLRKFMTKLHSIMFDDRIIEIHHNINLRNKPYLVRVFTYNNYYPNEFRLSQIELQDLYKILDYNENIQEENN